MSAKITTVLLMVAIVQVSAAGFAQKVTFKQKNASLTQIFKVIKQQTGYGIVWPSNAVKKIKQFDVNFKDTPLDQVLEKCFKDEPFNYKIEDKVIVIKEKTYIEKATDLFRNTFAENIDVSGKVTDDNGKPLPMATIRVKGGKRYAVANSNGDFIINKIDEKSILVFSYLGYETKEVPAAKDMGSVTLKAADGRLDEVSVISTGYQQVQKKLMTGSVAQVKSEDLVINGTTTIEQMLQGKLAGMAVVNNSGQLGTRQTVRIRGTSTLLGNQEPVWVVDGIIQEDPLPFKATQLNSFGTDPSNAQALKNYIGSAISWLNPYDIEDVTILKDAASTAIYGVKAANGVIVINTKRGKPGRAPSITYSTSFSTQQKPSYNKMDLMNSKNRVDVSREIYERGLFSSGYALDNIGYQGLLNQYLTGKLPYDSFNAGAKQLETNNTDWFNLLFVQPLSQSHNLSISGGGNSSTYYGSFGYSNQKGQAKGNNMDGYMGSINFTSYLTPKLSVSARLSGNYSKTTGFLGVDPYQYASTTSRVIPAYNPDGTLSYYQSELTSSNYKYNVLNELANSGNDNIKTSLSTALSVKYTLPLGFQFQSDFGLGYTGTHAEGYQTQLTNAMTALRGYEYGQYGPTTNLYKQSKLPVGGQQNLEDDRNVNYTWKNQLNYGTVIDKKHTISASAGLELRSNQYTGASSTIYGYLPDMGKIVINPPATIVNGGVNYANPLYSSAYNFTNTDGIANYVSYYVTGAYSYDDRYVFSASLRGDASNKFGQDARTRFNPIWALGGKWNVAREHWFDKSEWFNEFSIRASYGFQGNVAENYGPDLVAQIPGAGNAISTLTGESLLNISSLPYANLRWEKTQTTNLGLDFGFFKNRISASVDYYRKHSTDLIVLRSTPYEDGVLQMPMNGGTLSNSGFEAQMTFIPVRTKNLTWSITVNSAKDYNTVTNPLTPNPTWATAVSGSYYKDGYPVSGFWVFDFKGLDPATGLPQFNIPTATDNINTKTDASAFMKYAGKLNADFTSGFGTSVRYKEFTFSTNLYASLGGSKILAPLYPSSMVNSTPAEYSNLPQELVNRWRQPGDEAFTNIPSLPYFGVPFVVIPSGASSTFGVGQAPSASPYTLYDYSTARVVNASYLRINNINVSYMLPEKYAKRIFCKNLSVTYTLSNVYTFVSKDFKGVDPEVASGGQPLARTHAITLSVTF
ncbi:SusC/RagA family TonB-linked outer membrane protein [Pedobacter nutrimenti]|uniref:SusC/RagA family TonB-linked outer membrane protein n=1 Tax=Pedobacter nutrimenti TaxID=1241337 RepID=UPI00292CC10E|nr:SusC/RagA family TonB-linked outer membrane protein [Pedobacter nutrimenti]